jgi:hypothetical protein
MPVTDADFAALLIAAIGAAAAVGMLVQLVRMVLPRS